VGGQHAVERDDREGDGHDEEDPDLTPLLTVNWTDFPSCPGGPTTNLTRPVSVVPDA
jgi:hypothetical protein